MTIAFITLAVVALAAIAVLAHLLREAQEERGRLLAMRVSTPQVQFTASTPARVIPPSSNDTVAFNAIGSLRAVPSEEKGA